ncbi:MAG: dUTP diphosphatase [Chitinispirillales bacterium]|jgi:dUTP pyrophosphatase|nr:dUTP diphosphatase [Chitinispirillales bacterium]
MSFSGIIFDVDGTLYAMTKSVRITTLLNCFPHNINFFKYLKTRHSLQGRDFETKEKLLFEISELLTAAGVPNTYEKEVFYPAFIKTLKIHKNRPQLINFVKYCKSAGLKTAVLSDYGIVEERVEALGFDKNLFDFRFSSEDFGAFKPCPRIFSEVCKIMGVEPSQTLMVGDRGDTDGEGAKSVGMPFFKLNGTNNKNFENNLKTLYSFMQNALAVSVKRLAHNVDLPLPGRMTLFSSGADIRAANHDPIILEPGQRQLIPTGLVFEIPIGYEMQIRPRSGLAHKNGITVLNSPGTVDSDYRGEVFVLLINLSDEPFWINRGERIAQAVLARSVAANYIEKEDLSQTNRGVRGFGHTGKT